MHGAEKKGKQGTRISDRGRKGIHTEELIYDSILRKNRGTS